MKRDIYILICMEIAHLKYSWSGGFCRDVCVDTHTHKRKEKQKDRQNEWEAEEEDERSVLQNRFHVTYYAIMRDVTVFCGFSL